MDKTADIIFFLILPEQPSTYKISTLSKVVSEEMVLPDLVATRGMVFFQRYPWVGL